MGPPWPTSRLGSPPPPGGSQRPAACFVPTALSPTPSSASTPPSRRSRRRRRLPLVARDGRDLRANLLGAGRGLRGRREHRQHARDPGGRTASTPPCGLEAGVVMAGFGPALCWFEGGITDSHGAARRLAHGLETLLPGSMRPHFDSEPAAARLPPSCRRGRATARHRGRRRLRAPLPPARPSPEAWVPHATARVPTASRPARPRSQPAGSADEARGGGCGSGGLPRRRQPPAPHLPEPRTWADRGPRHPRFLARSRDRGAPPIRDSASPSQLPERPHRGLMIAAGLPGTPATMAELVAAACAGFAFAGLLRTPLSWPGSPSWSLRSTR